MNAFNGCSLVYSTPPHRQANLEDMLTHWSNTERQIGLHPTKKVENKVSTTLRSRRPAAVSILLFFPTSPVTQFQLPALPRTVAQFTTSPQSLVWPSLGGWAMVWIRWCSDVSIFSWAESLCCDGGVRKYRCTWEVLYFLLSYWIDWFLLYSLNKKLWLWFILCLVICQQPVIQLRQEEISSYKLKVMQKYCSIFNHKSCIVICIVSRDSCQYKALNPFSFSRKVQQQARN